MINQIDSCLGGDVDLMMQDPQLGPSCKKIQELQVQYKKELKDLCNTVKLRRIRTPGLQTSA